MAKYHYKYEISVLCKCFLQCSTFCLFQLYDPDDVYLTPEEEEEDKKELKRVCEGFEVVGLAGLELIEFSLCQL